MQEVYASRYAAIVIDADTGDILFEKNANSARYPASLTKMMTIYLAFDALAKGELKLSQTLPVSNFAASRSPIKLGLKPGDRITVDQLISSLVVRSANDAAAVLAEGIGGDEDSFAQLMTRKARQLGMRSTTFRNASGLPDEQQQTTAADMARLSIALRRDFPNYYAIMGRKEFSWNGNRYQTHNRVTLNYPGADGLKTGYIRLSGFNLATSVKRDGYSLVAVVMGGTTSRLRDQHMMRLLDEGIEKLARKKGDRHELDRLTADSAHRPEIAYEEVAAAEPVANDNEGGDIAQEAVYRHQAEKPEPATGREWGIQVGAFEDAKEALMAAANAVNLASTALSGTQIDVQKEAGGQTIHRARVIHLSREQAKSACTTLMSHNEHCFVYRLPRGEL